MVVGCPKCKARLNIPDERIKPEGSKFKCPKCAAVLMVKKPVAPAAQAPAAAPPESPGAAPRTPDKRKIIIAHERPDVVERIKSVLASTKFQVTVADDGVDTLIKALKELPYFYILDAALPKIDGYEITRRLRAKAETSDSRVILISSDSDMKRQQKQPASAYGVDEYVDEHDLENGLVPILQAALGVKREPEQAAAPQPGPSPAAAVAPEEDKEVARAKRLARIVLSDIDLYSPDKVLEAVRSGSFETVFAEDLKEGLKHYEKRIPAEVRNKGNFFQEAIDDFIEKKKSLLGL